MKKNLNVHIFVFLVPACIIYSLFMDLKDAGRVDGASEYRIFFLILPMVRPALATVAVFTIMPIWNGLWFPLILAPGEKTKTLILGAQMFMGQFITDWNSILAALSLAALPVLFLYLFFSAAAAVKPTNLLRLPYNFLRPVCSQYAVPIQK